MDSVWQQAAKKRWPGSQIFGDGPFAMHAQCCQAGTVFLFWFYAEVKAAQAANCGHAFCRMQHTAYQLKPAVQATQFQAAHSAGYGRD
jgi:hypothetical protein